MFKTSLIALIAAAGLGFAFSSAPAHAATLSVAPCDCRTGDDEPTPTTNPDPGKPGKHHDSDEPTRDPVVVAAAAEKVCNRALGTLRRVTKGEVLAFTYEPGVMIRPVCEGSAAMKSVSIDKTQAASVVGAIRKNPTMVGPLSMRGYEAEDVVGISVKDQVAILYVHRSGI